MFRKLCFSALVAQASLAPSLLFAGGPPWLCLPIEGVSSANAADCTARINAALKSKMFAGHEQFAGGAAIKQAVDSQQYLTLYIQEDVRLSDIEAALKGTEFKIPRDKLHLFGHVVLEIDGQKTPAKDVATAVDAIEHVTIAEADSNKQPGALTVEMPYPVEDYRSTPKSLGSDQFAWSQYLSSPAPNSEPPTTAESLPTYTAFSKTLAQHGAKLKDIRWSTTYACRNVGAVSVPKSEAKVAAATR